MRKFVLIFAALAGEPLVGLEDESKRRPATDFPIVVSASGRDEAQQLADRIATVSGCRLMKVMMLPDPRAARGHTSTGQHDA